MRLESMLDSAFLEKFDTYLNGTLLRSLTRLEDSGRIGPRMTEEDISRYIPDVSQGMASITSVDGRLAVGFQSLQQDLIQNLIDYLPRIEQRYSGIGGIVRRIPDNLIKNLIKAVVVGAVVGGVGFYSLSDYAILKEGEDLGAWGWAFVIGGSFVGAITAIPVVGKSLDLLQKKDGREYKFVFSQIKQSALEAFESGMRTQARPIITQ